MGGQYEDRCPKCSTPYGCEAGIALIERECDVRSDLAGCPRSPDCAAVPVGRGYYIVSYIGGRGRPRRRIVPWTHLEALGD